VQVSPCEHAWIYTEHMPMIVSTRMLYHYLSAMPLSHWFHELSYPCNARTSIPMPTLFVPTVYYCYYYRCYFTTVVTISLLSPL
jgi:hypothetical protein